jgi:signal peptidase I
MSLMSAKRVTSSVAVLVIIAFGGISPAPPAAASSTTSPAGIVTLRVPSPSMLPTLKVGSAIRVNLNSFRTRQPNIGDIVVFHPPRGAESIGSPCGVRSEGFGSRQPCGVPTPQESKETFVERVVGLPGDRISIVRGHVIRNGVREKDPYIIVVGCATAASCNFPMPVLIPPGDYFMMGDNRGHAYDSRFWGPIRKSWLVGKVVRAAG